MFKAKVTSVFGLTWSVDVSLVNVKKPDVVKGEVDSDTVVEQSGDQKSSDGGGEGSELDNGGLDDESQDTDDNSAQSGVGRSSALVDPESREPPAKRKRI